MIINLSSCKFNPSSRTNYDILHNIFLTSTHILNYISHSIIIEFHRRVGNINFLETVKEKNSYFSVITLCYKCYIIKYMTSVCNMSIIYSNIITVMIPYSIIYN